MSRRKALIVKFGQIGDVIMALPSVRSLYEQGFAIDWACGTASRNLLSAYTWINVIAVDDKAMLRGTLVERARSVAAFWRVVLPTRYDLCATMYYDRRFHFLTLPVRAKHKIALSRRSRKTMFLPGRHQSSEYSRVFFGAKDDCRGDSCPPLRPDRLPSPPLEHIAREKRIAIVPGGTSNVLGKQTLRRWPVESYVLLAQELIAKGFEVVLIGNDDDTWVREHFNHLRVTDCLGTMSLQEVISACDNFEAVISHDTGPLHLAGLSTACLIGIFGPTDPHTFLPRRDFAVGIWGGQGFACRPCYDGHNFAPCTFNGCMHQVTPKRVLQELDLLLQAHAWGISRPWKIVFPEPAELPLERSPVSAGSPVSLLLEKVPPQ